MRDGVIVNEYLKIRHADIYAAGDVANYQDVIFGKHRRVEHWDNAVSQGQYCAHALMGEQTPFRHVPYFFRMFSISLTNTGVMHREQMKSFIAGISPARASAYGGFSKNVLSQYSQ